MILNPLEVSMLELSIERVNYLDTRISIKQRRDMDGKEKLIYDTYKLNEQIKNRLELKKKSPKVYY